MIPTYVLSMPTGQEKGQFLTVELANVVRVCKVLLGEELGKYAFEQEFYAMPNSIQTSNAEHLWYFVADCLQRFMHKHKFQTSPVPLGFTFSYPALQQYIDHGILRSWTKGLDIKDVEGEDVVQQLRTAISERNLPVRVVSLSNDTTGTLMASAYTDRATVIGGIFGTGINACYMEEVGGIRKMPEVGLAPDRPMAINCEYGAFDNARLVLPTTEYDDLIDRQSPRPGEQAYEKMSAGMYIGEIYRSVLVDAYDKGLIFDGQDPTLLRTPFIINTDFISLIENDHTLSMQQSYQALQKALNLAASEVELVFIRRVAELVALRGTRLTACGPAAILLKRGITRGHVAADDLVVNRHPKFKRRWAAAIAEILDWPEDRPDDPIIMTQAVDGSGVGAAVIAAMTIERARMGDMAGIKEGQDFSNM